MCLASGLIACSQTRTIPVSVPELVYPPENLIAPCDRPSYTAGGTVSDFVNYAIDLKSAHGDCADRMDELRMLYEP